MAEPKSMFPPDEFCVAFAGLTFVEELNKYAMFEFPEVTWQEIQNEIFLQNNSLTKKTVIKYIKTAVVKNKVPDEDLEIRLSNLSLIANAKQSKKQWTAFRLQDQQLQGAEINVSSNNLGSISQALRRNNLLADIRALKFEGRVVFSVTKRVITKRSGVKKQVPIVFQHFLELLYVFCARKTVEKRLLVSIAQGLGFDMISSCNLTGVNVIDLLKQLRCKESSAGHALMLLDPPEVRPEARVLNDGIDFSQYAQRMNYAEFMCGKDKNLPVVQTVSVGLKDTPWQPVNNFNEMNGQLLDGIKMTFHAPNIADLFKKMIKADIVHTPLPAYMEAVLAAGKTNIKMTQNK